MPDPDRNDVTWHGDSEKRVSRYQFNTKKKDQLFCPKCGASLGIDFREFYAPKKYPIGVSVSCLISLQPWPRRHQSIFRILTKSHRFGPSMVLTLTNYNTGRLME